MKRIVVLSLVLVLCMVGVAGARVLPKKHTARTVRAAAVCFVTFEYRFDYPSDVPPNASDGVASIGTHSESGGAGIPEIHPADVVLGQMPPVYFSVPAGGIRSATVTGARIVGFASNVVCVQPDAAGTVTVSITQ